MSRSIDSATLVAAKKLIQTKATGADPRLSLWIGRPVTQLVDTQFLETIDVTGITGVTDAGVAVKHTHFGRSADAIYIAYVTGGVAKVAAAKSVEVMKRHSFADQGFSATAERVAVCFDGTMPKRASNTYEFITEPLPWVFWMTGGKLFGRKLGSTDTVTLAEQNCTWVSAVRAMWSEVNGFDFGLCVFMILSGTVYYRQLIGGVWYDAEVVPSSALPTLASGVTFTEVAASRTWDYRVVLQLKASDGTLYEVFTQFGGLGSKGAEHIEVRNVKAAGTLTAIKYSSAAEAEHIEISSVTAAGKLRQNVAPGPTSVKNVDDGTGVWDKRIEIMIDRAVIPSTVSGNAGAFAVTNAAGGSFAVAAASCSTDGLTITLSLSNALTAGGDVTVAYTPGSIDTDIALDMAAWMRTFTPTHLTKPDGHDDEHVEISSVVATGTLTKINYADTAAQDMGHIEVSGITATGTLTPVSNI